LLGEYPEIADELAACLDALGFVHQVVPQLRDQAKDATGERPKLPDVQPVGSLGDFQILREIGRGGMGVVYEAEQISLGRRVALKVLPFAAMLDERQLKRFQNEARAAASLKHANIVSVYSVGCERAVHFYAMEYVEGQTLAEVIDGLRPLEGHDEGGEQRAVSGEPRIKSVSSNSYDGPPRPSKQEDSEESTGSEAHRTAESQVSRNLKTPSQSGLASELASGRFAPAPPVTLDAPSARRGSPDPAETADRRSPDARRPAVGEVARSGDRPQRAAGSTGAAHRADGESRRDTSPVAAISTDRSTRSREFFRTVAGLGVQATEALDYAHTHGVLHRDVKPGNLILDAESTLWITDFGLAHMETDASLTLSGDILGTVRYMSPEQALAKRVVVDHRTDIYSLGATLYELLTLRPAFPGRDRQELLRQIAFEEPKPPRKLNRAIPGELETIVTKAIAKNPAERYETAQDLADDLARFLEDKPIKARPPSLAQRAAKWSRRHKPVVVAAFAIFFVASLALCTSTVMVTAAYRRESGHREIAERAAARAERNFQRALEAVEIVTDVGQEELKGIPHFEQVRRELLEKALSFHQGFLQKRSNEPQVRFETGMACIRVGNIQFQLEDHQSAEKAYGQAITLLEKLRSEFPDEPDYRKALGTAHFRLGRLLLRTGRPEQAEEALQLAIELQQKLATDYPENAEYHQDLGHTLHGLGALFKVTDRPTRAEEAHLQAQDVRQNLVKRFPAVTRYREDLASTCGGLSNLLAEIGRPVEAKQAARRGVEILEELVKEDRDEPDYREDLARSLHNLGFTLWENGEVHEPEQLYSQAIDLQEKLVHDFPSVPVYRRSLARSHNSLGILLLKAGRFQEAAKSSHQAVLVREELANRFSNVPDYQSEFGAALHNLAGVVCRDEARVLEARQLIERAILHQQAALKANPKHPRYRQFLANHYWNLADALIELDEHADALKAIEELVGVFPDRWEKYREAACLLMSFVGRVNRDPKLSKEERNRWDQAYGERARELLQEAVSRVGEDSKAQNAMAWLLATCSDARFRDPHQAVELAEKAVASERENADYWNTLGVACYRAGDWNAAIDALSKCIDFRSGGNSCDWFFLAAANWQLGRQEEAREWYHRAVDWMNKNEPDSKELRRFRAEAEELLGLTETPSEIAEHIRETTNDD